MSLSLLKYKLQDMVRFVAKMLRILETNTQQKQDVAKLLSECSRSLVRVGAVAVVPLLLLSFLFSLS